jgi:hypothetical protein
MTSQNMNNSSCKLKCKERGMRADTFAPRRACDEKSKYDRSSDRKMRLCGRLTSCGQFNNPLSFHSKQDN